MAAPAGLSTRTEIADSQPAVIEIPAPRRLRAPRAIAADDSTQLRHTQLAEWNSNYVTYMATVTESKINQRLAREAKEKAAFWVLGTGIGNVGLGVGMSNLQGALSMFSGDNLMQLLNTVGAPEEPKKRKTPSDEAGTPESERRRVRARQEAEEQVGRGDVPMEDDDAGMGPGLGLEEYVRPTAVRRPYSFTNRYFRTSRSGERRVPNCKINHPPCPGTSPPPHGDLDWAPLSVTVVGQCPREVLAARCDLVRCTGPSTTCPRDG